jgi:hypothetical protein
MSKRNNTKKYKNNNELKMLHFSRSILLRGGMQTDGTHSQVEHGARKNISICHIFSHAK